MIEKNFNASERVLRGTLHGGLGKTMFLTQAATPTATKGKKAIKERAKAKEKEKEKENLQTMEILAQVEKIGEEEEEEARFPGAAKNWHSFLALFIS